MKGYANTPEQGKQKDAIDPLARVLIPRNWRKFQHYSDRKPTWIKLHRELLDDAHFHRLPTASRALAPMLWLLAAESIEGRIPYDPGAIAWRLRMAETEFTTALQPLVDKEFFSFDPPFDSKPLAQRYPDATSETETETETDKIYARSKRARADKSVDKSGAGFSYVRGLYPRRAGQQRWPEAERAYHARIADGHTHEAIVAGVNRYTKFLKATGKLNTEYVMQAATFLGRNLSFLEEWTPPSGNGTTPAPRREDPPSPAEIEAARATAASQNRQVMQRLGLSNVLKEIPK